MACLFHKWDGCKCAKCGKPRDEGHLFEIVPNKCQKECTKCGHRTPLAHKWVGCKCEICGEQTSYIFFDSLNAKELDVFTNAVIDITNKWISAINVNETTKDELKIFLTRFEEASGINPFRLIIDDVKIAINKIESSLNLRFEKISSGLEIKQGMMAMDMVSLKSMFGGLEGYRELLNKLRYDLKKYRTLPITESNKLTAPCTVTITRPKLFSSGPKNNTKTTVFLNATEVGSFIAGEILTTSTHLSENLISCMGNDDPPISFQAQPGGEIKFKIIIPNLYSIESFGIAPE